MTHSWNGKYRRPAGLATGDFQAPMKGDLLWVYEGLTEYWGDVLAARSGLWTKDEYLERIGAVAGWQDSIPGKTWRPLEDTAIAAQFLYGAPDAFDSWRRDVDFYDEGELVWLEVDVMIRKLTSEKKSLDDFAAVFYGGTSGAPSVKTYGFA